MTLLKNLDGNIPTISCMSKHDLRPDDANLTTYFYRKKFERKERQFNRPLPLVEYLRPLIGNKTRIRIAELGSGPINTIGNEVPGVDVEIVASDMMWPEFEKTWTANGKTPLIPIHYEDFERLSYADNSFDIVHCANALDHTKKIRRALNEMKRICKPGGWVYLRHATNQKLRYGGGHYWNFYDQDGLCVIWNRRESYGFDPSAWKTAVLDNEEIVLCWQKPVDMQP